LQCSNNATSLVVTYDQLSSLCEDSVTFCASANDDPRKAFLCSLQPPSFAQLPASYQAILEAENCYLNGTYDKSGINFDEVTGEPLGAQPLPPLSPWCRCFYDGRRSEISAVLNFVVANGVNTTSGSVAPPVGLSAPAGCPAAPFVAFKDLYLCDGPGLPGGSCADNNGKICPFGKPVDMWNISQDSSAYCRANALAIFNSIDNGENATVCLPAQNFFSGGNCQVQRCRCADPVSLRGSFERILVFVSPGLRLIAKQSQE
jgi:hypothetical protein